MAQQTAEVLSTIGAIQTLVENFPMGLFTSHNVKTYSSGMDFMMDALKTIGVSDTEILALVLKRITGVNDLDVSSASTDELTFKDNAFITKLEAALKAVISVILADIVSCSIWPKIPGDAITKGIDIPIKLLDSNGLLDVCPTSDYGLRLYCDVNKSMTPRDTKDSKDLNALMWYCLNMVNMVDVSEDSVTWVDEKKPSQGNLCTLNNRGYQKINFQISDSFSGKTLHYFNMRYLDNTRIISPKIILMNILNEYANGMPNIGYNFGFTDVYQEAVFKKIITTIVSNDDMGVNDCYYTFSNDEWYRLLEETELRKYDAKKAGDKSNTAVKVDKESIIEALDQASSASTLHDRTEIVNDAIYNAANVRTVETDVLVQEGTTVRTVDFDFEYNPMWLYNILSTIITPIMRAVITPKVMALVVMNYEIAGAVNLDGITEAKLGPIVEGVRRKLLGIIAAITKKVKDWIIDIVLEFFNEKILPLINKYLTMKLIEQLDYYLYVEPGL